MFEKVRKGPLLCGFDWEENSQKRAKAMKKKYPSAESEICVFVYERKTNRVKVKVYKKCRSPIQNGFYNWRASYQNILFFFALKTVLKNGEATSKGDFESISAGE